ncbi:MAG TPA: STAS domain-containing protein [Ornithinibacter sp.]|nr:STAS domain-containing protein [Ornithinibacter sp.]
MTLPPAEGRGGRVVHVAGRLDASSAPVLRRALLALDQECGRGATLVIDLSGVESCDAAGLAPLLLARRRAVSRSYGLALGAPSRAVERTLATHHLTATFTVLVADQPG